MAKPFIYSLVIYALFLISTAESGQGLPYGSLLFGPPLTGSLSSIPSGLRNRIFRKHAPVLPGVAIVPLQDDMGYACPHGFTYLSYDDASYSRMQLCLELSPTITYRLLGGGSMSGCSRACQAQPQNTRVLKKAICVHTNVVADSLNQVYGKCPSGSSRISYKEAMLYACNSRANLVSARIGYLGSFFFNFTNTSDANSGECIVKEFDLSEYVANLCITREIIELKIVDSGEDVCGEGKSLVTLTEVFASLDAHCSLLEPYQVVRLAGGGSLEKSELECRIRDTDVRKLQTALCANIRPDIEAWLR